LVVGAAIVIVIAVVQVIVITRGGPRITEVAARFVLDSFPGKQIAIEAEYNSDIITEAEAISRKEILQHEVDFYGALNGSSKFFSSNFKVGILINALTILIGILIGIKIHGEPIADAVGNYTSFAIGASLLITQLPSVIISTAIGIIVNRSNLIQDLPC
jgi:flagellar biosynthesis protein FlhA